VHGSSLHGSIVDQPVLAPVYRTRSKTGHARPKTCTDGTIRYCLSCSTTEPATLQIASADSNWKNAMDYENRALMENKTWHLVPFKQNKNWKNAMDYENRALMKNAMDYENRAFRK
jgi:hypothetical protein